MKDIYIVTVSIFGERLTQSIIGVATTQELGKRIGRDYLEIFRMIPNWETKTGSRSLYSMQYQTIVTVFPMILEDR